MNKISARFNTIFTFILVLFMLANAIIVHASGTDKETLNIEGFSKGVSHKPVIPVKKTTFVNYDEYSDVNTWDRPQTLRFDTDISINGHMPFGSVEHPHEKQPESSIGGIILAIAVLILIVSVGYLVVQRKKIRS